VRIKNKSKRAKSDYTGIWKIQSVKNNSSGIALDITRAERVKPENKVAWAGININLQTLIECGLEIVIPPLTGSEM
jgi:hypothetical protein